MDENGFIGIFMGGFKASAVGISASTDFFLYCKYHFPAENEKNSNWNGVVKMDKEKLKAYGVDYENAVKRFAGNEALYEKFLKKLTEDDHLAIGEQAMKKKNGMRMC